MTLLGLAPPLVKNAAHGRSLNIASISTLYPSNEQPHRGVFVERRLNGLSQIANVRVIQPVPWFPVLRPRQPRTVSNGRPSSPRVSVAREPMFYLPGIWKSLDAWWLEQAILPALLDWKHDDQVDLIDAHFGYPEGVAGVRAARRLGVPAFVTVRGNEVKYLTHPRIGPLLLDALLQCAGIITVSHSLKQALGSHGVPLERIEVIPNAVDTQTFRPGSQAEARDRLGLPPDRRYLISVGHLVYEKGHHLAIESLPVLRKREPDLELIILGGAASEAKYPQRLQALAAHLGVADAVRFVGSQHPQDVATWLQAADVFVLATYREGCCNAVLEALACGKPVVTTAAGDNEYYVAPPQHGLIVPCGNALALVLAVTAALKRTWDSQAISRSIMQLGGWDAVARSVARFFEKRLGNGPRHERVSARAAAGGADE